MKCSLCSQQASIHLTEIVNGQMIEVHLCETCAEDKGTAFKTHFNFNDVFGGFEGLFDAEAQTKSKKAEEEPCPECGMRYSEFTKNGRLGCAQCYSAFKTTLFPLIKRVQRSASHIGKKPKKISSATRTQHDLSMLQDQLRKSIQNEAFEDAAKLRDQIKKLEAKHKRKKSS